MMNLFYIGMLAACGIMCFKVARELNIVAKDLDNHVEIRKLRIRKGDRKGN